MITGSCQCGAVRFEVDPPLRDVINCHCTICRKTSGHHWAATNAPRDQIRLTEDRGLAWFHASDVARRGFCRECGSSLFYERHGTGSWSIGAGTLDTPTGLSTVESIYEDEAGDYYTPAAVP